MLWKKPIADPGLNYTATGAPLAIKDKVIVGIAGAEGGIRGFLDAYDAKTGERAWRFWTVPAPGEPGSDTWGGDSWKHGGASTWLTGSYDPELNLLYWGTGNPGPDYNGDVRPGDNLYSCSLLALDLDTGKLKWHFQFTPHDTRDFDATQIPVLIDSAAGRKLVVVPSRNGFHYVLDRETGEFLLAKPFVKVTWAKEIDTKGRPGDESRAGADARRQRVDLARRRRRPQLDVAQLSSRHQAPLLQRARRAAAVLQVRRARVPARARRSSAAAVAAARGSGRRRAGASSSPWFRKPARSGGSIASWRRHGPACSRRPGNLVFSATPSGNFYALDARTGKELWQFNGGDRVFASPITFLSRGKQIVTIPIGDNSIAFGVD